MTAMTREEMAVTWNGSCSRGDSREGGQPAVAALPQPAAHPCAKVTLGNATSCTIRQRTSSIIVHKLLQEASFMPGTTSRCCILPCTAPSGRACMHAWLPPLAAASQQHAKQADGRLPFSAPEPRAVATPLLI